MMWLGLLGCSYFWVVVLAATEYSDWEGSQSGNWAATAALAAVGTFIDERWEGRPFLPIQDAVFRVGTGIGLVTWLQSRGLVRVRDRVCGCVGGGGGEWDLGVVLGLAPISESVSTSFSSPYSLGRMFWSAPQCPIWAGRTSIGDHVSGLKLMGSGELSGSCGLPDIPARIVGTQVFSLGVPWGRATDIST